MSTRDEHTTGPWRLDRRGGQLEIVGRPEWPCTRFGVAGEWRVARVDDLSEDEPTALPESKANARLIAAAPELLAALKAVADDFQTFHDETGRGEDVLSKEVHDMMFAALAKVHP